MNFPPNLAVNLFVLKKNLLSFSMKKKIKCEKNNKYIFNFYFTLVRKKFFFTLKTRETGNKKNVIQIFNKKSKLNKIKKIQVTFIKKN